ncbi:MAG: 50S ribosomal protein L16 3-hydroxylase [Gammaproteobacteria bacterium]|jgi:50S ribosomal protein L16 3-hydroxylase
MSILGTITTAQFIERHWQKEALLIRGAFRLPSALIDGDELAGLACEDDVESRLVQCDSEQQYWLCEDGPFDEDRFAELPSSHWTLLVQGVDRHEPLINALLSEFDFLPRWRTDDIMLSYAVDGGGVGAHFDDYDVFLLQLQGTRRWQLGQRCDEHSALHDDAPLKLLREFHPREDYLLEAGDMLYLPPGLAHCGTAVGDDCITASIGYRSPSLRALAEGSVATLMADLSERPGYRDTPQAIDADPFRINAAACGLVSDLARTINEAITTAKLEPVVHRTFGEQITEPRQVELIHCDEPLSAAQLDKHINQLSQACGSLQLEHHPSSRFAYADNERAQDASYQLFVDGECHDTTLAMARGICHGEVALDCLTKATAQRANRALLLRLINQGSVGMANLH